MGHLADACASSPIAGFFAAHAFTEDVRQALKPPGFIGSLGRAALVLGDGQAAFSGELQRLLHELPIETLQTALAAARTQAEAKSYSVAAASLLTGLEQELQPDSPVDPVGVRDSNAVVLSGVLKGEALAFIDFLQELAGKPEMNAKEFLDGAAAYLNGKATHWAAAEEELRGAAG